MGIDRCWDGKGIVGAQDIGSDWAIFKVCGLKYLCEVTYMELGVDRMEILKLWCKIHRVPRALEWLLVAFWRLIGFHLIILVVTLLSLLFSRVISFSQCFP